MNMLKKDLAKYIDFTKLKAESTQADIESLLKEAKDYNVKAVCVNPCWVKLCSTSLKGTDIGIATVIGFPLGANLTSVKSLETELAIMDGATEIDMVINVGWVKSGLWDSVKKDIKAIVQTCHKKGAILKVILENSLLTKDEIKKACEICLEVEADFVKTSTGFSTSGAKVEDIKLMKSVVGDNLGIKASGGVKTYQQCLEMIEAGATRIGTSSIESIQGIDIDLDKLREILGPPKKDNGWILGGFIPACCDCKNPGRGLTSGHCDCSCHILY